MRDDAGRADRGAQRAAQDVRIYRASALAFGTVLLSGCATVGSHEDVEGVIFPATRAPWFMGAESEGRWTPSRDQMSEALVHVRAFLQTSAPVLAKRLPEYRCQYFGIIVGNRRRIYCNFFRELGPGVEWRISPVLVKDGGDAFFQLQYDVDSKQCLDLNINGEA